MQIAPLPPITRAEREATQDDLFTTHTLVCGGCGAVFTSPRLVERCAECNAGVKAQIACLGCQATTTIPILQDIKLCGPCRVDLVITASALRAKLDAFEGAADDAYDLLMADLAHADDADRARYDAACERAAEWPAERWARARDAAIAKGDGLSPLLTARRAWDDAAAALERVRGEVARGLEEVERAKEATS